MRWLADENLHANIVKELRSIGHEVIYAAEVLQQDADHVLLDRALVDGLLVLTEDKNFGDLIFRDGRRSAGVILLRVPKVHWTEKWNRLRDVIAEYGHALHGRFTVIDPSGVRTQLLPHEY